jgi:hypothetical protein
LSKLFAGVEFVARPEPPSDQGFEGIGWASRISSCFYAAQTIEHDRQSISTARPRLLMKTPLLDHAPGEG